jgi:hypothetical protein
MQTFFLRRNDMMEGYGAVHSGFTVVLAGISFTGFLIPTAADYYIYTYCFYIYRHIWPIVFTYMTSIYGIWMDLSL